MARRGDARASKALDSDFKEESRTAEREIRPQPAKVYRMPTAAEADEKLRKDLRKDRRISVLPKKGKRNPKATAQPTSASPHWTAPLLRKRNGDLIGCRSNVSIILRSGWPGELAFDEFTGRVIKRKKTVGHKDDRPAAGLRKAGPWTDDDTALLQSWLERMHEMPCEVGVVRDGVRIEARRNAYHPIRDYLSSLQWDGRDRADTWLIRNAAVDDNDYARAVSSKWLISAVARIFEPGCQVDHVLVLEGFGRSGKTSLLRVMAGNEEDWFASIDGELGTKDVLQTIATTWILELGELESLGRTGWERVKHFITNKIDKYRKAYGHEIEVQRRSVVLAGTTNKFSGYLREPDQRFWPLRSRATKRDPIRLTNLAKERDQLWAEVVARFRGGEPWHITDPKVHESAVHELEARCASDPWQGRVHSFVKKSNRSELGVTTEEILDSFGFSIKETDRGSEMRVAGILHALGWERRRSQKSGSRKYRYYPIVED